MYEYFPLLIVGAVIGLASVIFIVAYAMIKDKKEAIGFDRNMKDGEITKRLLKYARPYTKNFIFVLVKLNFSSAIHLILYLPD